MRPAALSIPCCTLALLLTFLPPAIASPPAPYTGIPSAETRISVPDQLSPANDVDPMAFSEGRDVCVIARENWTLQAMLSADGGRTFGAPVAIAGGPAASRSPGTPQRAARTGGFTSRSSSSTPSSDGDCSTSQRRLCRHRTTPADLVAAGSRRTASSSSSRRRSTPMRPVPSRSSSRAESRDGSSRSRARIRVKRGARRGSLRTRLVCPRRRS